MSGKLDVDSLISVYIVQMDVTGSIMLKLLSTVVLSIWG